MPGILLGTGDVKRKGTDYLLRSVSQSIYRVPTVCQMFTKEIPQLSLSIDKQEKGTCFLAYFSDNRKHMLKIFTSHG